MEHHEALNFEKMFNYFTLQNQFNSFLALRFASFNFYGSMYLGKLKLQEEG